MKVIPSRYVFKIKNSGPKARIVAKGFRQVHGVDYVETFAPVISLTAVRLLLFLVVLLDLEADQMDFITAFLNGSLDELCLLYTSPSPRDLSTSRMPSSA